MRPLATLLVTSMLIGSPRAARAQDDVATSATDPAAAALEARAQALYQDGREHFRAGRFEAARAAFLASLERYDSPNTRMYLGRALDRLGRVAEAFVMLDRAARDAADRARTEPRYDATRAASRAEADALRPGLAWLRVQVDPARDDLSLALNDGPAQRRAAGVELPLAPGEVRVIARAEGYVDAATTVVLAAGESREIALTLRPVVAPRGVEADAGVAAAGDAGAALPALTRQGPVRTAGAVIATTGLLTVATGLAFGLVAWDQYQTVRNDDSQRELAAEGIRNRDAANSLLAAGGVLSLAGAVMFFFAPQRAERAVTVRPALGLGAVGVAGSF
jgi:tetratricopeptide (TPR) repeat protein